MPRNIIASNHYLYRITCHHPEFFGYEYIGIRTCVKPIKDDPYMGSGIALNEFYKGIGKGFFSKEILLIGPSREYISQIESNYVDEEYINRSWVINLMTGGEDDGRLGSKHSEKTRIKMKASSVKALANPKIQAARKKMYESEEWKTAHKKAIERTWSDPDHRKRMALKNKAQVKTKKWIDSNNAMRKKMLNSKTWRKNNLAALRKTHADPEIQKRQREAVRKMVLTSEWKAANLKGLRKRQESKEYRKNQLAGLKKMHADTEYQKKQRAACSKANKGKTTAYIIEEDVLRRIPVDEYAELKAKGKAINPTSKEYILLMGASRHE